MVRTSSYFQLIFAESDWFFEADLDVNNRWLKMKGAMLWDGLAKCYYASFSSLTGRPAKDAQLVISPMLIKRKLGLSDSEAVAQIQGDPYLQYYFVGLSGFQMRAPFAPSLFVEIRKRMRRIVFGSFLATLLRPLITARRQFENLAHHHQLS